MATVQESDTDKLEARLGADHVHVTQSDQGGVDVDMHFPDADPEDALTYLLSVGDRTGPIGHGIDSRGDLIWALAEILNDAETDMDPDRVVEIAAGYIQGRADE